MIDPRFPDIIEIIPLRAVVAVRDEPGVLEISIDYGPVVEWLRPRLRGVWP